MCCPYVADLGLGEYRAGLLKEVERVYAVAAEYRRRTNDPLPHVETVFADRIEERVELLVGPPGIAEKIRGLRGKLSGISLAFKLSEEIIYSNLGGDPEQVLKQAICTSLAILTPPCITAAPSEGISHVRVKENDDGSKYLAVYFAGPIRAAGGTELATVVVLADYVRRLYGLDRFKPREEEVRRFVEELRTYIRQVGRFQYNVPDRLIAYAYRMTPVEITGVATNEILVSSHRDLERIETNYLRGGALRVVNDGIVGRAKKVLNIVRSLGMSGWDWIEELAAAPLTQEEAAEEEQTLEVIGGRPVFSLSNTFGGFRIRYGRAFATGMAAFGIHPMSMKVLKGYVVTGTQLKTDFPGKGGIVTPVDTIEPPVVKTANGDVYRVSSEEVYAAISDKIDQILFLGDILVSVGDCVENNVTLRPPGYCEEWWRNDLASRVLEMGLERVGEKAGISVGRLAKLLEDPFKTIPTVDEALRLSREAGVPLHPRYLHCWRNIKPEDLQLLREWISSQPAFLDGMAAMPYTQSVKEKLETLLVEHRVRQDKLLLSHDDYLVLCELLNPDKAFEPDPSVDVLENLRRLSGLYVKDKVGSSLTARMGRPEKAGPRRMTPSVHFLFPVGLAGGALRDLSDIELVAVELVRRRCLGCGYEGWEVMCRKCGGHTVLVGVCERCRAEYLNTVAEVCGRCGGRVTYSSTQRVNVAGEVSEALQKIGEAAPPRLSGVKGLTSFTKTPETVLKGVLRAKHGLTVYKDGTIRFDATNAPLTHFTPSMLGLSVERLRDLGYTHDVKGDPLVSENQVCELKLQDIVLSRKAAEHLIKVARFVDDLLHHWAGMEKLYMLKKPEDLIGHLVVGLSPHTYVGVVARVIGFVDAEVNFAHPAFHAAKRRDCDGDEDSVMLLADVLMNFSRLYIPDRIGGKMDTPLLITRIVYPEEVDEQAHNVDVWWDIPAEFYRQALQGSKIATVKGIVRTFGDDLAAGTQGVGAGYTHRQIRLAVPGIVSAYKSLETMMDKIYGQLDLMDRLAGVRDSALVDSIVSSHILPDIIGNVRAFMVQNFRCKKCNRKFRRLPLTGRCPSCQQELSLTVFRGAVEKYLELAREIAAQRLRNPYLKERTLAAVETVLDLFTPSKKSGPQTVQTRLDAFSADEA